MIAFAIAYLLTQQFGGSDTGTDNLPRVDGTTDVENTPASQQAGEPTLISNNQAQGSGTVVRILPDDNEGSRHQRFILELPSGRTILVAHNIDIAARVADLQIGDRIEFYGEFESNPQGGVIHWTHRDLNGNHVHGWLRHAGIAYQ